MDDHESSHRSLPNVSNTNTSSSSPPDNPPPPPNCNNFKTNNNTIHHLPNTNTNTNTTTNNNNTTQNNNNNNNNSVSSNSHAHHNKEQDRFLPIANVGRIMKKVIPGNGKISKDAKETVQECVSEFISFVTGEASDKCQREKRKTINGDDIIWAITTLGFEDYVAPLKTYLNKYRQIEEDKINNVPKQQQQHRTGSVQNHDPTQHDHAGAGGSHQSLAGFTGLYSSSSPSPTSFLPHHHHHHHFSGGAGTEQGFMLPFSAPMPKQLQQQDNQIDSGGRHW